MMKIPCTLMRAGTSKAVFFIKSDLPVSVVERDIVILKVMGSPDIRQINGIGGGDPLSSKIAILDKHEGPDADVNFLFAQVLLDKPEVNTQANCGNVLSGVAPFAIEKGLIAATKPVTNIRIFNINTQSVITATVQTPNGQVDYCGNTSIAGVPGAASPILLNFGNVIGSSTGELFPTGNIIDNIDGIKVSFLDCAIPVIFISALSLGITGSESKLELDQNRLLLDKIENIRQLIIKKAKMEHSQLLPKVAIVSPASKDGDIASRYFTPKQCHATHAVTGAICLSLATKIKGTIPNQVTKNISNNNQVSIEHPGGTITISITLQKGCSEFILEKAEVCRTARPLFEGHALI